MADEVKKGKWEAAVTVILISRRNQAPSDLTCHSDTRICRRRGVPDEAVFVSMWIGQRIDIPCQDECIKGRSGQLWLKRSRHSHGISPAVDQHATLLKQAVLYLGFLFDN